MVIVLFLWTWLTLTNPYLHGFNHPDELHAYDISLHFSIPEIFRLMRSEGHAFVWFLIMKPFAYFNFAMGIKIINWIFAFSALFVMWKFAPFNSLIKILITFSEPMLNIYPISARCYAIGVLGLFLIAAMYKKRLKNPYLYAALIFFTANTSLMAAIPALIFGVYFCIEIIKEKKNYSAIIILLLTLVFLAVQWHNPIIPNYQRSMTFYGKINDFIFGNMPFSGHRKSITALYSVLLLSAVLFFKNNFKILLFWLFSFAAYQYIFYFVYCGDMRHFYFWYISLIILFWIGYDIPSKKMYRNIFLVSFSLISLLYITKEPSYFWSKPDYYSLTKACILASTDRSKPIYTTLFVPGTKNSQTSFLSLYFIGEGGYHLKDYEGGELNTFDNFSRMYSSTPKLNVKKLKQNGGYLLINPNELKSHDTFSRNEAKYLQSLESVRCGDDAAIYRLNE